jgi:hypothetical protein
MHGTIFVELQKYVETKLGKEAWPALLHQSGVGSTKYEALEEYPDSEVVRLVTKASEITGSPMPALLQDFGEFIAPDLLSMYWGVIKPEWKTLDVIEHTEKEIHSVVRLRNPNATPPYLKCDRINSNEVVIHYNSPRKLCPVAKGIAYGLAKHYDEKIELREDLCMHRGDESCEIHVMLV